MFQLTYSVLTAAFDGPPAPLVELTATARFRDDGGIDGNTLPLMKDAGATAFVAATAVFKHPQGPGAGVKTLLNVIARSDR